MSKKWISPTLVIKFGLPATVVVIFVLYFILFTKPRDGKVMLEMEISADLEFLRQNGRTNNLSAVNLETLDADQILLTMHSYLDNTDVICQRKLRMGNVGDGGWEICDDLEVRPNADCIVYSFGINYDFSFDDDAARLYGCHVYAFDPSMDKMETGNRSNLVHFYKIGISDHTFTAKNGWNLYTLGRIRTMLGHQKVPIDVIKMDIESSEWEVIPEMISTGQLTNVRQLLVEYHVTNTSRSYLLPRLKAIQDIENAGFKKFYVHKNFFCAKLLQRFPIKRTECYEIHYIKGLNGDLIDHLKI